MANQDTYETIMSVCVDTLDVSKMKADMQEMERISDEFPADAIVDIGDTERLAGLSMRGMSICDYWIPILMVIAGEIESKRDLVEAKAYLDAESSNGRLTADVRKFAAKADDEYNKLKMLAVRYKSMLESFRKKWTSFEKFHHWMKEVQRSYDYKGGRHINGDEPIYRKQREENIPQSEEKW